MPTLAVSHFILQYDFTIAQALLKELVVGIAPMAALGHLCTGACMSGECQFMLPWRICGQLGSATLCSC